MGLRPYQTEAVGAVEGEWTKGIAKTLLVLPTGCHSEDTELLMADGTTRRVTEISIGDRLLGADGTPRTVLARHCGQSEMSRIIPVKGNSFVVTNDHKLTLIRTSIDAKPRYPSECGGEIVDVSVSEVAQWSKWKKHIHKLVRCSGIERFERPPADLPIDPYFLGVLLGGGGLAFQINVTTAEREIVEVLNYQAVRYGMRLDSAPAGKANTYTFVGGGNGKNGSVLHRQLTSLGIRRCRSGNKFVPDDYKYAPASVRLETIAGLIDTDGCLHENEYDFISKSERLANDLAFMCRSVGLAAYVSKCKKGCGEYIGDYWRVSISGDCDKIPCRVERRKAEARKQKKSVLRTGFSIEPAGTRNYVGFTVDGDNRYLMSDFTITHNCGKTVVFANIAADRVRAGDKVLILAHRGELLDQAADKIGKFTGLACSTEKAELSSAGRWERITVGSVQTMMQDKRLARFAPEHFGTIIIDEAHHALSSSYQKVLEHFAPAKVLGVTATPDRGDMKNLGQYFETLAYEYTLPQAIREGYLCKMKAQTIPLKIDMEGVRTSQGDYKASDVGSALEPYLEQIADEMRTYCAGRKTVVFLPLIETSKKFCAMLTERGFRAAEVNGGSDDRAETLAAFERGDYDILCNSMLLTEGWDCPSVDCVVVLRPTKVRSLYTQMIGRGTRLHPGKDHLLILDFLWHTERHELCRPACLICDKPEIAEKMTENLEDGEAVDLVEAEEKAESDALADREAALAKMLEEQRHRKRALVDPLQFEMSIAAEDLAFYTPSMGWEIAPPTKKQIALLEKRGIFPDEIDNAGKAQLIIDRLMKRQADGLTTPKQIRFLEGRGFKNVGLWQFSDASSMIGRISSNGWRIPHGISPETYKPDDKEIEDREWLRSI